MARVARLEARVLRSPALDEVAEKYELLVVEAVAAWADERFGRSRRRAALTATRRW